MVAYLSAPPRGAAESRSRIDDLGRAVKASKKSRSVYCKVFHSGLTKDAPVRNIFNLVVNIFLSHVLKGIAK